MKVFLKIHTELHVHSRKLQSLGLLTSAGKNIEWLRIRLHGRLYSQSSQASNAENLECISSSEADALFAAPGERQTLETGVYLVGTPIGNLQDMTFRAISVLKSVSLILAEDTRHTGKLLSIFNIRTPMSSYHSHNESGRSRQVIERLKAGESIAVVSDAGMPGISDPGFMIVQDAIEAGVKVIPVPGACALVAALVASGLPTDCFMYCGFLPPKQGARRTRLQQLRQVPSTMVFYVPPHGLREILKDMAQVFGSERRVCVARELTKLYEEFFRSDLKGALEEFTRREPRGEMCVVVQGCDIAADRLSDLMRSLSENQHSKDGDHEDPQSSLGLGSESGSKHGHHVQLCADGLSQVSEVKGEGRALDGVEVHHAGSVVFGPDQLKLLMQRLLKSGLSKKDAAREASKLVPGLSRKEAYAATLTIN